MSKPGKVYLIGAGPGNPDLLTVKAARLLEEADVVVYDRLVSSEIMKIVPQAAYLIPVGKAAKCHPVPQSQINAILVEEALKGRIVIRLKGGDPFIFGRGSEEALHLRENGISVEVVPGITAAQGAACATSVPLTHRGLATSVQYITGHRQADQPLDLDWKRLANPDTTLVIYMGVANIGHIAMRLINENLSPSTPVLAVAQATTQHETRLLSRLDQIAHDVQNMGLTPPVLFLVGRVVSLYSENTVEEIAKTAQQRAYA